MGPKPHILVADDDANFLSYLETFLKSRDFIVNTARDGKEARDNILQYRYDLFITDIQMPHFNGFELVSLIKERDINLPVIMISGMATLATADKAIVSGAITLLTKPINTDHLVIAVNKALTDRESLFKRHRKILIVDDNDEFRLSASHFIKMAGYEITDVRNGKEALRIAQEANPHFDIALIDEVMPGMSGHQVIHKLKEVSPETLPILISGEATRDEIGEAYKEGAFSYIRKPVDFTTLLQCLANYEREEEERLKEIGREKMYATLPFYNKLYYWAKGYINAPPNSTKNLQFRVVWVSLLVIVLGLIIFYVTLELQKYNEEMQAKIDRTAQLLEERNRLKEEEMARKREFYRKREEK